LSAKLTAIGPYGNYRSTEVPVAVDKKAAIKKYQRKVGYIYQTNSKIHDGINTSHSFTDNCKCSARCQIKPMVIILLSPQPLLSGYLFFCSRFVVKKSGYYFPLTATGEGKHKKSFKIIPAPKGKKINTNSGIKAKGFPVFFNNKVIKII
jgi:hypothetical protein